MHDEFLAAVTNLGNLAKDYAAKVPPALADTGATKDQVERLWEVLGRACDKAEELIETMEDADADESLIEAAQSVEDIFLELHLATGKKLVGLGGLAGRPKPGEFD